MNTNDLNTFPKDTDNRSFTTADGVHFIVRESEHFPEKRIAAQHRKYLTELRPGLLVSVSFYGKPVPVITVEDGVVRLDKVVVGGAELTGPAVISKALHVAKTRQPVRLSLA